MDDDRPRRIGTYYFDPDARTAIPVSLAQVTHVTYRINDERGRDFTFHLTSGESVTRVGLGLVGERDLRERLREAWGE